MKYRCGCINREQQNIGIADGLVVCWTCGYVAEPETDDEKGACIDQHAENAKQYEHHHKREERKWWK